MELCMSHTLEYCIGGMHLRSVGYCIGGMPPLNTLIYSVLYQLDAPDGQQTLSGEFNMTVKTTTKELHSH